ncbi:Ger(x)C family spore germination protein [Paenibacillus montanisoli]|uniref:Ger(X)C family spore germination protein n=1 Tax=Paenibacillus montanisoli TaxID=2081970 RepID=A0A328U0H9_9BACL|nr:Ger(x)C family spore germination protein [Paenibacillus montanisoli]RAP74355.1 Ger(x)C family spore germination protein [Paenibacillus montanisoli]
MKRAAGLVITLIILLSQTSCFGLRQINELAIVTAVGLGLGDKPGTIKVSAQIIRPADARGQTGAPSGGTGQPIYSISAEGTSIFDAIRNLGRVSSRRVYWAHNFLIVMDEDYARKGIKDMVDFFTRNHELRMNTRVAVTPDLPDQVVSTITGLEVVPGEAVDRLFQNNHVVGRAPASDMMNLEEAFLSSSTEPVLARVQLKPRGISNKKPEEHGSLKQVELGGAAAFLGDKMVGWLSVKEARGLLFFLEKLGSGIEVVKCPNNDGVMSIEFKRARLKVTPSYANKEPKFGVRLTTEADIVESGCAIHLDEGIRQDAEEKLEQRLKSNIDSVIDKAQHRYHSDFLKLGDVFRNKYPEEWRVLKRDWNRTFSDAKIDVEVEATIKSGVLKSVGTEIR